MFWTFESTLEATLRDNSFYPIKTNGRIIAACCLQVVKIFSKKPHEQLPR